MKLPPVFWLRLSYWIGAVIDVLAGLSMLFPALFAFSNRLSGFVPDLSFRFMAGMGAPLMFGWTVLLLWADRKPLERKAVLLITLIPILGNAFNQVVGLSNGFLSLEAALPLWINQTVLTALYVFSYWNASK
jgi:hypothetical protein